MWIFVENETQRILAAGSGEPNTANCHLAMGFLVAIPEQDLGLYGETADGMPMMRERYYPRDVVFYTDEQEAARIDRDTDAAIGAAVHPIAPRGEEAAIHREQLQAILDKLVMKPTAKFARLTEIAQRAIAAGKEAKAG